MRIVVIGIGSGHPGHLTGDAVAAMNAVDLFLVADKGPASRELAEVRTALCAAVISHDRYRVVQVTDPERARSARVAADAAAYREAVGDWHAARVRAYAAAITAAAADRDPQEPPLGGDGRPGETAAADADLRVGVERADPRPDVARAGRIQRLTVGLLVWGDPAFYDSTIRIAQDLGADEVRVIPGISSLQLLAAGHRLVLNTIGGPIHVTTGRRLLTEYRRDLGSVVVMLDSELACAGLLADHPDLEIFWGAQLGLPGEAIVAGRLRDVLDEIRSTRSAIRRRDGWVMDTYLLRYP